MFQRSISEFSKVFAIEDSELTQTGIGECKVELEKDPIHKIKYPGVGDRVLIRIPAEKLRSKNPKLANEWQGPYRVLKTTDNSAEVAPIIGWQESFCYVLLFSKARDRARQKPKDHFTGFIRDLPCC
uniref:Uncharacterized protein n=1 Tax=Caenorhabditis japonica TaxID=281687 RepID=A0A8R1EBR0_CAEJA